MTSSQIVCSIDCVIEYKKQLAAKKVKQKLNEVKVSLLTKSDYTKILQGQINNIVRNIDIIFPCISSSRDKGQFHAGHYYSTGAHPNLRFNLLNIWKQSAKDNNFLSGNLLEYQASLKSMYPIGFKYIENLPLEFKNKTIGINQIKDAILIAKDILKQQKKGKWIARNTNERWDIRCELNQILKLYNYG